MLVLIDFGKKLPLYFMVFYVKNIRIFRFFDIQRGCRQGDPILAILFILAGQILTLLLKHNKDILGLTIGNIKIKLTHFADDTTLI